MVKHSSVELKPEHLFWLRKRKWKPGIDIKVSISQAIELLRVLEDLNAMRSLFGDNAEHIQGRLQNATINNCGSTADAD